jgi:hypothetical protein
MEKQQCLPFVLLTTYVPVDNKINIESLAMNMQQCVLFIAALHTSVLTTCSTPAASCKVSNIFARF